jgi:hypothetical protein
MGARSEGPSAIHTRFYDFFSQARWEPDDLSELVVPLVLELIPEKCDVVATVDDTLAHRSGAHIWGAGMHHDALRSNYGRGTKRVVSFAFGHSWVIVCLLVPVPWSSSRMLAIPVLCRLYRSKKTAPPEKYRKRSELAAEMLELLCRWLPSNRRLVILGDDEYACSVVATRIAALEQEAAKGKSQLSLPAQIILCGPMAMNAAFYECAPTYSGRGRPPVKGRRLLSPRQLAADPSIKWQAKVVHIYGRTVEILTKTQTGLWYSVTGSRKVRMVVTRDPKGRIDERAYFVTDATWTVEQIIVSYSRRWCQEVLHRNLKQHFGLDDPQNGWWRHPAGLRRDDRLPGPRAHETKGVQAATHTVPFVLCVYAFVVIWYIRAGNPAADVARVRRRAPWYVTKSEPSFADMLAAARREILFPRLFSGPASPTGSVEIDPDLAELYLAA